MTETLAKPGRARRDTTEPPAIPGVRRSFVTARSVDFHVTESGPEDGRPVLALHGWPEHHYTYRDLLADPQEGLRIIAPDLPGYGWSGIPAHRWSKEDVAADVLALIEAMGLRDIVLIGHDWGGVIGYKLILSAPEHFDAFLALNIAHPWQRLRTTVPKLWRFASYQVPMATIGAFLQRRTKFLERVLFPLSGGDAKALDPVAVHSFCERFTVPERAKVGQDTYRTFLRHEAGKLARGAEQRRATVPIKALFGIEDFAIHHALADPRTAKAGEYSLELVAGCGHFITEQRPDLVRASLAELARRYPAPR
ncbi:alpha/beta fold hydrolase [Sciscionella sediminilitoris]|uniref:alpha/beta fold hydrolase n=1 Tax=Sciscionella sediminilitoris TaxID=1445613 RepID=UPI00068D1750|nr:alpha/beta hydrolase [Sciscionella sp. SE31]